MNLVRFLPEAKVAASWFTAGSTEDCEGLGVEGVVEGAMEHDAMVVGLDTPFTRVGEGVVACRVVRTGGVAAVGWLSSGVDGEVKVRPVNQCMWCIVGWLDVGVGEVHWDGCVHFAGPVAVGDTDEAGLGVDVPEIGLEC